MKSVFVASLVAIFASAALAEPPQRPKPQVRALSTADQAMVGTWTMRDGGKALTYIRMVFRPNGDFRFVGPNWSSSGKFRVTDHTLSLEWTMVDGSKVKPGQMKKDFAMGEGNASFTIDRYTYFKLPK